MTARNRLRFQENGHEIWITIPPKVENQDEAEAETASTQKSNSNGKHNEIKVISLDDLYSAERTRHENQDGDFASSKLPFVWKLYEMLEDVKSSEQEHIVSWVEEGTAFRAHKLEEFVAEVIPKYFKLSKFKSFQRQLYFYGFTRIPSGPNTGAYRHPKFIRDNKSLCLSMTPVNNRRRRRSSASSTGSNGSTVVSANNANEEKMTMKAAAEEATRQVTLRNQRHGLRAAADLSFIPSSVSAHYDEDSHLVNADDRAKIKQVRVKNDEDLPARESLSGGGDDEAMDTYDDEEENYEQNMIQTRLATVSCGNSHSSNSKLRTGATAQARSGATASAIDLCHEDRNKAYSYLMAESVHYQKQNRKKEGSPKVDYPFQQKWLSYGLDHLYITNENDKKPSAASKQEVPKIDQDLSSLRNDLLHPQSLIPDKQVGMVNITAPSIDLDTTKQGEDNNEEEDDGSTSSNIDHHEDIGYVYGMPFHYVPEFN